MSTADLHALARRVFRRASMTAVCAVVLWCGSQAEASCGDYVMVGGHRDAPASAKGQIDFETPGVPRCHGPMCSDNSIPPVAPVPKMNDVVEHWAMTDVARLAPLPPRHALLA